MTLSAACKVSVVVTRPIDLVMGDDTVITPASVPLLPVVIVTLLAAKALEIALALMALVAVGLYELAAGVPDVAVLSLTMSTFHGSSSQLPAIPCCAAVDTRIPSTSSRCPEVSTRPPLPPCVPPCAVMVPCALVTLSAQTMTVPPSPAVRASALMMASLATVVVMAFGSGPFP